MNCDLQEIAGAGWGCERDRELRPLGLVYSTICLRGGSCLLDSPIQPDQCPWGTRDTVDCAEFGVSDCDGVRCGCPTDEGRIIGARA